MSVALPEAMRAYIDERVRSGHYGNTSEYLHDLVLRLRQLIGEGLKSGAARPLTDDVIDERRARALSEDR